MPSYLAARCPQCTKWIAVHKCDADAPTMDPTLLLLVKCLQCGQQSKLAASALEIIPESKLELSPTQHDGGA